MNRNIITRADAARARSNAFGKNAMPAGDEETALLLGVPALGVAPNAADNVRTDDRPDKWFERIAKYVPAEALTLYFALAGAVGKNPKSHIESLLDLSFIALTCVVFNALFLRYVWRIGRWGQIAVSCLALLGYAFASGGVLVQQLPFYGSTSGTVTLIVMSAFLGFVDPPSSNH